MFCIDLTSTVFCILVRGKTCQYKHFGGARPYLPMSISRLVAQNFSLGGITPMPPAGACPYCIAMMNFAMLHLSNCWLCYIMVKLHYHIYIFENMAVVESGHTFL